VASVSMAAGDLNTLVSAYVWPFFRVAGLVAAAPIFGIQFVPAQVKVVMALAITVLVVPLLPAAPTVPLISLQALLILLQQVLIGLSLGVVMNFLFNIFVVGGQLIATNMGLGYATVVDPQSGVAVPVLSQFYVYLTSLMFLSLNGHLVLIEVLANSFTSMPVGVEGMQREMLWQMVHWAGEIFRGGLLLALPALAALLLVNVALGVVMRAAPQFNIMSIGFPITLTIGFVLVMISLPALVPLFTRSLMDSFEFINRVFIGT